MKYLLPLALFVFTFPAAAQKTCDLTLKDSPEIRGIKLGMPEDDINKVLGWSSTASPDTRPRKPPRTADFEGLEDVRFDFYKGRLAVAEINYNRSVRWNSEREFARALSKAWGIPIAAWRYEGYFAILTCAEFEVRAVSLSNNIRLTDTVAMKAIADEKRKAEEAKKQAFKP